MNQSLHTGVTAALVAAVILVASPSAAQTVRFGITGGLNRTEINAAGDERLNVALTHKSNAVAGLLLEIQVHDSVTFEPELLFSVKGSNLVVDGREDEFRLRYLELPALFVYSPPDDQPSGWLRLLGGPYLAYLLTARAINGQTGQSVNIYQSINSWDVGWLAGVGLDFGRGYVDFRYSGGITDIAARRDLGGLIPPPSAEKYRNRGFSLVAAYVF